MARRTTGGTVRPRVNKDGSTSWQAQVRMTGHKPATGTFQTKTEAKDFIARTRAAMLEGRYHGTSEAKRRTFADLCDRYDDDVLAQKRASTQSTQRAQLEWWRRELGHLVLRDVTSPVIDEALRKLAAEPSNRGKPRSPATINRWHALISHVLASGVRWSWIDDNPTRRLQKRREPRGRVRWLDDGERKRLLDACADGPEWLRPAVLVLMLTGLRLGELKRLRWPNVDLKRGSLVVHESKNSERRSVPLFGPALDAMREASKVRRLDTDLVFPAAHHNFHRAWYPAIARSEINDFRVHDLRHTCASLLVMSGADMATVATVLGHKQLEVTKRYAHLSDQHLRSALSAMASKYFG